jgi:hypothetical protein
VAPVKKRSEAARPRGGARRTFQIAFFGAAGAGKRTTLRGLHQALPAGARGPFVAVPDVAAGGTTETSFFDYQPPRERGLIPTFRLRGVTADSIEGQAFLSLLGCDAVVFLFDADPGRRRDNLRAWKAAGRHFATYEVDLERLPVIVQVTKPDRANRKRAFDPRPLLKLRKAPAVETNPAIGSGLFELARTVEREVARAFHEGRAPGRPTTAPSARYTERAEALAAAVDVAAEARSGAPWAIELATRQMALHPELGHATLSSLASLESVFFTSWNEGDGPEVEAFWRGVARRGLPFRRRDAAVEALARGRITNRGDYDTVTDLVSDVSNERFSRAQQAQLGSMLGAYEQSALRPRRRR